MKRYLTALSILAVAGIFATQAMACDEPALDRLLDAGTTAAPDLTVNVETDESTDSGEWQVYLGPDAKARVIARTDYGETGRLRRTLLVIDADTFAVTSARSIYSVPYAIEGSRVVREEKDIWRWCDGKLVVPPKDVADLSDYEAKGAEALKTFDAPEIRAHVAGLRR